MNNSDVVDGDERACHLDRNIDSFTDLNSPTPETLTQRLAFDQFTGDVMDRVILTDLVNRQDIWMIELHHRVRFSFKPLQALGVAGKAQGGV